MRLPVQWSPVLDYHLHLWPHGTPASGPTLDALAAYCEAAAQVGVHEIALTEHLFRFREADAALAGFWDDDPNPALRGHLAGYWNAHVSADLDTYVDVVLEAKRAGLPIVLGMEVDFYRGRMSTVADLLAAYPFDVLLGSVHWIGSWGFDILEDDVPQQEWSVRAVDRVWDEYTRDLEELAASGVCDVLAHPDLVKIAGRIPTVPDEFYDRMAEAAAASGMAAELSSAGWRKPLAEVYPARPLLDRFRKAGVPITMASDAHRLSEVAYENGRLRTAAADAGYDSITGFRARRPDQRPLEK
jgi:histidinol-phosphatase (PHP family)